MIPSGVTHLSLKIDQSISIPKNFHIFISMSQHCADNGLDKSAKH